MPMAAASVVEFVNRRRVVPWRAAGVRASLEERLITWTADEFFQMLAAGWT